MDILCEHCHKVVGSVVHHTDPNLGPTLCPECGDHFLAEYGGVSLGEYLDKFEEPMMVFNDDLRVVACNRKGRAEVHAPYARPFGLKNGHFLDCRNAVMGGVCGQTPDCPQCGIRNSVTQTLKTGESVENHPASLTRAGQDGIHTHEWNVSTRKVGNTVHLKLQKPVAHGRGAQFRRV